MNLRTRPQPDFASVSTALTADFMFISIPPENEGRDGYRGPDKSRDQLPDVPGPVAARGAMGGSAE